MDEWEKELAYKRYRIDMSSAQTTALMEQRGGMRTCTFSPSGYARIWWGTSPEHANRRARARDRSRAALLRWRAKHGQSSEWKRQAANLSRTITVNVATAEDEQRLCTMLRSLGYDVESESELSAATDDEGLCPSCAHYRRTPMDDYLMPECEGEHCPFACPHIEPERAAAFAKAIPLEDR